MLSGVGTIVSDGLPVIAVKSVALTLPELMAVAKSLKSECNSLGNLTGCVSPRLSHCFLKLGFPLGFGGVFLSEKFIV